jgi:hypothetical protein
MARSAPTRTFSHSSFGALPGDFYSGESPATYAVPGIPWIEPTKLVFYLFFTADRTQAWTYAKRSLSFAALTNDDGDGGAWFLDRL